MQARRVLERFRGRAASLSCIAEKALPELDEKAKELLALERYLGELDNPQVAFAVRQRELKTVDEAVTATLEIQSYLRPGVRQEVNAATVAEEVGAQSIAATLSTSSCLRNAKNWRGWNLPSEMRLRLGDQCGRLVLELRVVVSELFAKNAGKWVILQETALLLRATARSSRETRTPHH